MKKVMALLFCITWFSVSKAQPTIVSFSSTSGGVGIVDTIYGTGFSTTPANNIVRFGATRATVSYADTSKLVVLVPTGATRKPITVTVSGLTAYSAKSFIPTFGNGNDSVFFTSSFAPSIDYPLNFGRGNASAGSPSIADIDGDGKPDMIVPTDSSVSVFPNINASGNISFGQMIDIPMGIGRNTNIVSVEDLNGDGKLDFVVINYDNSNQINRIYLLQNTSSSGNISFSLPFDLDVITYTQTGITIRDLDGDGKPDIVVANSGTYGGPVSVYKNTSNGPFITFSSKVDLYSYSGIDPVSIATGDMDGDGKPDITVSSIWGFDPGIKIFRNKCTKGNISFDSATTIIWPNNLGNLLIEDMDGDGKLDIVGWEPSYKQSFQVYKNRSTLGNFLFSRVSFSLTKIEISKSAQILDTEINDFDGDGKPDIAILRSNFFSVYKNTSDTGTIAFSLRNDYASTSKQFAQNTLNRGFAIGDLNGDGKPDVIVASSNPNKVSVLKFIDMTLPSITSFSPESGPIGTIDTIYGINFNPVDTNNIVYYGATRADIIKATANMLIVSVPSGASFENISVFTGERTAFSSKPFKVTFAKENKDIDSNSFSFQSEIPFGNYELMSVKDFDGDGRNDICTQKNAFPDSTTSGTIGFNSATPLPTYSNSVAGLTSVDLNNDGKPDLAITGNASFTTELHYIVNNSSPSNLAFASFNSSAFLIDTVTSGNSASSFGDFDGDRKTDLVIKNGGNSVSVLRNIGSRDVPSFADPVFLPSYSGYGKAIVSDIDGDTKPDIITLNEPNQYSTSGVVWIYRNTTTHLGNISFNDTKQYTIYPINHINDIAVA
ncbi:MAG: FG-GAP-like repeat-containing protein, partial [Bacteroidia bacterium]